MGMISYLREIPGDVELDPLETPVDRRVILFERTCDFWAIDDYTRSQPTAPSPGRIYRKNLGWPADRDDNWWVYVVQDAPADDPRGGQLHHPFKPMFIGSSTVG